MSKNYKKVCEEYFIDESLLQDLASRERKGDFFSKSLEFYNQVKERPMHTVSQKQQNWLWELSCVLRDRAENLKKPKMPTYEQKAAIQPYKKESLGARIFKKIGSFFGF